MVCERRFLTRGDLVGVDSRIHHEHLSNRVKGREVHVYPHSLGPCVPDHAGDAAQAGDLSGVDSHPGDFDPVTNSNPLPLLHWRRRRDKGSFWTRHVAAGHKGPEERQEILHVLLELGDLPLQTIESVVIHGDNRQGERQNNSQGQ